MRFLAILLVAAGVLAGVYLAVRPEGPEPAAQTAARAAADSILRVRAAALVGGDIEAWADALAPDAVFVPPQADGPATGPEAGAAAERARVLGASAPALRTVVAGATRRGRLAWAAAALDTGDHESQALDGALHHSTALLREDEGWSVFVECLSSAPTWEELRRDAAAGRLPGLPAIERRMGHESQKLAGRLRKRLDDLAGIRLDREAVVVGPARGDFAAGDSAARVLLAELQRRIGEPRLQPAGLRAWVPRDRGVGWVVANLECRPPEWGGTVLPLRLTAVYRSTGEDSWRLVLAQLAVAVPDSGGREVAARQAVPLSSAGGALSAPSSRRASSPTA